jgi:uncharacterized protein YndB with AHSA1/START domain
MVRHSPPTGQTTLERPRQSSKRGSGAALLPGVWCDTSRGRTTVVMPREFESRIEDVWSLLTDPDRLAMWAPYTSNRDLSSVGRATLLMLDGDKATPVELPSVVFTSDAPRTLEHSWGEDTVTWTLEAMSGGPSKNTARTRLTVRQTLGDATMASAIAAGWHLCLDVAAAALAGHPTPAIRGMDAMDHGWADLNVRYAAKFGVEPTRIG